MQATSEGTERYVDRYPAFRDAGFYRPVFELAALAIEEGGPEHHFRFIQLPFHFGTVEAYTAHPGNVLTVAASAGLSQARVLREMPVDIAERLPGLATDAQQANQFTRSTPGISVALVGMSRHEHVLENPGVSKAPPAGGERYQQLYRR